MIAIKKREGCYNDEFKEQKTDRFFEFRRGITYDKEVFTSGVCLASAVRSVDVTAVSAEPLPAAYGDTV